MDDQDYSELRIRLMAHQVLLCAALATHPNKPEFLAAMAQVTNQMQSLLLPSRLAVRRNAKQEFYFTSVVSQRSSEESELIGLELRV